MAIKKEQLLEYQKLQQEFTANPDGYAGSLTELFTALIELKDEKTSCELLRRPDAFTKEQLEELTAYLKKKRGFSDVKAELEKLVSLTALTIEKGRLKEIAPGTYKELILPEGIKAIEKGIFSRTKIRKLVLPGSLKKISQQNFRDAEFQEIVISEGTESIGKQAFSGCKKLSQVTIPATVKEIGEKAFQYCVKLSQIQIPDGVEIIGDTAFSGCTSLRELTIPKSVTSIGKLVCRDCKNLLSFCMESEIECHINFLNCHLRKLTFHPEQSFHHISERLCEVNLITDKKTYSVDIWELVYDNWDFLANMNVYGGDWSQHVSERVHEAAEKRSNENETTANIFSDAVTALAYGEIPEDLGEFVADIGFYDDWPSEKTIGYVPCVELRFRLVEIISEAYGKNMIELAEQEVENMLSESKKMGDTSYIPSLLISFFGTDGVKFLLALKKWPDLMKRALKKAIESGNIVKSGTVDVIQKALDEGYINESNINEIIMLANQCQQYELQVFLTNYSYEHFPAVDVLKKFSL